MIDKELKSLIIKTNIINKKAKEITAIILKVDRTYNKSYPFEIKFIINNYNFKRKIFENFEKANIYLKGYIQATEFLTQ